MIGDRKPTLADMKELQFTTRVINESMRLYPQPPVLIRRALKEDNLDGYTCKVRTSAAHRQCRGLGFQVLRWVFLWVVLCKPSY